MRQALLFLLLIHSVGLSATEQLVREWQDFGFSAFITIHRVFPVNVAGREITQTIGKGWHTAGAIEDNIVVSVYNIETAQMPAQINYDYDGESVNPINDYQVSEKEWNWYRFDNWLSNPPNSQVMIERVKTADGTFEIVHKLFPLTIAGRELTQTVAKGSDPKGKRDNELHVRIYDTKPSLMPAAIDRDENSAPVPIDAFLLFQQKYTWPQIYDWPQS